ncbi:MAG: TIGR04076 family protein [Clostridiales bacterium]|nr:TIGR04076 family protein [Clostridiales bacterium]
MKKVKITVMKTVRHDDLIERFENPIEHACDMKIGQVFFSVDCEKPDNFCSSAWESLLPFVMILSHGGSDIYDGWMKDKYSAMISCNDGFRPVSFLLETVL